MKIVFQTFFLLALLLLLSAFVMFRIQIMKKLIYFLLLFLILFSLESYSEETKKKEIELTQKQIEYAELFKNDENYTKSEWVNSFTLELTYDIQQFYFLTKSEAQEQAILHAAAGYTYTYKDICVRILLITKGELAYECVGKEIPSES